MKQNMGQAIAKREIDKGLHLYSQEKYEAAIGEWLRALKRMSKTEKLPEKFNTLGKLCSVYYDIGKYREVVKYANQQAEVASTLGDDVLKREAFLNLARGHERLAEFNKSIEYCRSCIEKSKSDDQKLREIRIFANVCQGKSYFGLSDFSNSLRRFEIAMTLIEKDYSRYVKCLVLQNIGLVFTKLKDYDTAVSYYERCLDLLQDEEESLTKNKRIVLVNIAMPYIHTSRLNNAMEQCENAMKDAMQKSDRPIQAHCLFLFAEIHRKRKDFERSYPRYESSYSIFVEMGDRQCQIDVLQGMAKCMAQIGDYEQALELYQKMEELATEIGNKMGVLQCKRRMADLYIVMENFDAAQRCEDQTRQLTNELELLCGVCSESIGQTPEHLDQLPCGHLIHGRCAVHLARYTWGRKGKRRPCPACRARLSDNPALL